MLTLSFVALACLASVSCQGQLTLKPQGPPLNINHIPNNVGVPQVGARQLYAVPQGQQFYPDVQFTLLNPQLDLPSLGYIPDKQTFPGVQPQVLLYPGGAAPGQPFLLQPGAPPGNFLIPQPQPGPGPNIIYKGVPNRPPLFLNGYPKPAFTPPIEKDAEEIPTNPEKIPPFPGNANTDVQKRRKPEKLETFNEDENARNPEVGASEAPGLAGPGFRLQPSAAPKPTVNNLRPGQRFFVLNGIPIYSNYPFVNSPDFNLRFSQPEPLPYAGFPPAASGLPLPSITQQLRQPKPQNPAFQFDQAKLPVDGFQVVRIKTQDNNAQFNQIKPNEGDLKLPLKNTIFQPDPNTQTLYHIVGAPKGQLPQGGFQIGAIKGQLSQAEKQAVEAFVAQQGLEPKFGENYLQVNQPTLKQESLFRTALPLTVQGKDQETVQLKFGQKDFKLHTVPLYASALDGDAGYFQYDANGEDDSVVVEAAPRDSGEAREDDPEEESSPAAENAAEPSISQAHPGAIALAGPGGVAAAGPRGTALVGPGGLAVTSPQATAVAGPSKDQDLDKQKDEKKDDKKIAANRNRKSRRQ